MKKIMLIVAVIAATLVMVGGSAQAAPTVALPVNHGASSIGYTTFQPSCAFHGKLDVGQDKWGTLIVTGSATFSGCDGWNRWQAHYLPVMQVYVEDVDNIMVSSPAAYGGGAMSSNHAGIGEQPVTVSSVLKARSMHRYRLVASIRPYTAFGDYEVTSFTVTILVVWPVLRS